jgi:hypothetical protein
LSHIDVFQWEPPLISLLLAHGLLRGEECRLKVRAILFPEPLRLFVYRRMPEHGHLEDLGGIEKSALLPPILHAFALGELPARDDNCAGSLLQ